jgi:menaquinone-dependent protoporphyrinogen IX oxidase
MKNAIVFSSKLGTTNKIISMMIEKANDPQVTIIDLEKTADPDLSDQDVIIIGSELIYNRLSWIEKVADRLTEKVPVA